MTRARIKRKTIENPVEFVGQGLHTGVQVRLKALPAASGTDVVFIRVDLEGAPRVAALLENIIGSNRGTDLKQGQAEVKTVEHFLAVVHHLGITDLMVEIDGPELPALDGSAALFLEKFKGAGLKELDGFVEAIVLAEEVSVGDNGCRMLARPAEVLTLSYQLEYDHPVLAGQRFSYRPGEMSFAEEISPARTFCLEEEVEELKKAGLAKGGSLDNALVIGKRGYLNEVVHFPDEPCRHKVLDMMGDLFLLGKPLLAEVEGNRSGHAMNAELARAILARAQKKEGTRVEIKEIMKCLPHRYPMLLVDRIVELEPGKRVVGIKNVSINEPFFNGHFPGEPVMPGVLQIEAMAQVGGVLMLRGDENAKDKIIYFMSVNNVKWRKPVIPGDQLRMELTVLSKKGNITKMLGKATVDDKVVCEGELMAMIADRPED